MKMLRPLLMALILSAISTAYVAAQELHCTVQVNADKVKTQAGVDASAFPALQNSITEFMNQRAWTQDAFGSEEKIECALYITLESVVSQDQYSGTITIQSSRPAFNSTYNSPILNFRDLDFVFTYAINTPIDFNVNQYTTNLSSVLGYYAYLIIGFDYATMSKGGGDKYFALAEQITNQVPSTASDSKGWKPFDSNPLTQGKNRYNIISSLMGGKFEDYKKALYEYHFQGIDMFYDDPATARANISDALDKIDKSFKDNQNNILLILFLQAKGDELVGIFAGGEQSEKTKVVNILKKLDPANGTKYDKILKT
jgi:hypothetical protein